ncbi:MAG: hypothetical protein M3Z20_19340 [Chloroflexota bacterium]|nr:hypothetical protein [Chloroflexota bacterium]
MVDSASDEFSGLPQAREFLDAVGPMLPAYRHGLLDYVALSHCGALVILYARLQLSVEARASERARLESSNLFAGQYAIDALEPDAVKALMLLGVTHQDLPPVHGRLLKLAPESTDTPARYSAYYDRHSLQQRAARNDQSVDRVLLGGVSRFQLHNQRLNELERELHVFGVDTVEQLLRIYGLDARDQTTLEVATMAVATFTAGCSLSGQRATLAFRLAAALDPQLLRIVIKNADPAAAGFPHAVEGSTITWVRDGAWQNGTLTMDLSEPLIVDCRLTYAGRPQAELRLIDEQYLPNPRRTLVDLVDPDAGRLAQLLLAPEKDQGRDFEAAFAWLLQLLGFDCLHIGAMSGLNDEPDILAAGPGGETLIVECTTKVPDDTKVTKLVSRTERMRALRQKRVREDPRSGALVLPMLVCSLPPNELQVMRAKAEAHSIVVLCLPELEEALCASRFAPDPARHLRTWLQKPLRQLLTGERLLRVD